MEKSPLIRTILSFALAASVSGCATDTQAVQSSALHHQEQELPKNPHQQARELFVAQIRENPQQSQYQVYTVQEAAGCRILAFYYSPDKTFKDGSAVLYDYVRTDDYGNGLWSVANIQPLQKSEDKGNIFSATFPTSIEGQTSIVQFKIDEVPRGNTLVTCRRTK